MKHLRFCSISSGDIETSLCFVLAHKSYVSPPSLPFDSKVVWCRRVPLAPVWFTVRVAIKPSRDFLLTYLIMKTVMLHIHPQRSRWSQPPYRLDMMRFFTCTKEAISWISTPKLDHQVVLLHKDWHKGLHHPFQNEGGAPFLEEA
jgi:hypothetical protein